MDNEQRAVHPAVLEGRDPWWRHAWSELPAADHRAIRDAYRRGTRVSRDKLLPFIYGLIARERRRLRWLWLPLLVGEAQAGTLVYVHCFRVPSGFCWLFGGLAVGGILAAAARMVVGRGRIRRAEAVNLRGRGDEENPGGVI
jgi:hypothetical protein